MNCCNFSKSLFVSCLCAGLTVFGAEKDASKVLLSTNVEVPASDIKPVMLGLFLARQIPNLLSYVCNEVRYPRSEILRGSGILADTEPPEAIYLKRLGLLEEDGHMRPFVRDIVRAATREYDLYYPSTTLQDPVAGKYVLTSKEYANGLRRLKSNL